MSTAPTLAASGNSAYNSTTSPKTQSVTVANGDTLVVVVISEDQSTDIAAPTGGSLTYTLQNQVAVASNTQVAIYTARPAGTQTYTLSVAKSGAGSGWWGFTYYRFTGSDGVGATAKTNTTGAPSLAVTTSFANSALVGASGDWNAISGARTWRTVNSITPTAGNGAEINYFNDTSHYTGCTAYWSDAGATGSKTVGLTAPTGQKYSIVVVEVQGSGATNFTQTTTETEGLVDSQAQVSAAVQTSGPDAEGLVDSAAQVAAYAQTSGPDAVGLIDAASQLLAASQAPSDAVGMVDAVSFVFTAVQTSGPDAVGIVDAVDVSATGAGTIDNDVGILDSPVQLLTAVQTSGPETVGITDSVTATLTAGGVTEYRFFDANPAASSDATDSAVNLGVYFYTLTTDTTLYAVWYYRPATGGSSTVPVRIFDQATSTVLVSFTSGTLTAGQWNRINLPTPMAMTANTYYVYSVNVTAYGVFTNAWAADIFDPPLYGDHTGATQNQQYVYSANPDVMPTTTNAPTGYGMDVTVGVQTAQTRTPTDPIGITDNVAANLTGAGLLVDSVGLVDARSQLYVAQRAPADTVGLVDTVFAQLGELVEYSEYRLFDSNPAPTGEFPDSPLNVGVRFYSIVTGVFVLAIEWYRPTGSPATVQCRLFNPSGAVAAAWTGLAPLEGAWNRIDLTSVVELSPAGQYWTASVHTSAYGFFDAQFATNIFDPPLFADGEPGANNGVFIYTTDPDVVPPIGSSDNDGYGVDVVVGVPVLPAQTPTDTLGITDSVSYFNGQEETPTDVSGIVDSSARVAHYFVIIDDIDSVPTEYSESIGITDSVVVIGGTTGAKTDMVSTHDSVTWVLTAARTYTDPFAITDSSTGLLNSTSFAVTLSDALGALDAQARVNAAFRAIVENFGAVDFFEGQQPGAGFVFVPPTTDTRALTYADHGVDYLLYRHLTATAVGLNVWKLQNGTYTQAQPLDMTLVAIEYLGGHRHPIEEEERVSLIAAGYGAYIEQ